MIDKSHFDDNCSREFIPYKGWIKDNDHYDELTTEKENSVGQCSIVVHELGHGNWHTTYNLQDSNGKMLFNKGVRKIEWVDAGLYTIEDDNEDELINKYGYIPVKEYTEEYYLADKDGKYLVEESFDYVSQFSNDLFLVKKSNKYNLILLSGKYVLEQYVDCIFSNYQNFIYYVDAGILYSKEVDGPVLRSKHLLELPNDEIFSIGRFIVKDNKVNGTPLSDYLPLNSGMYRICLLSNYDKNKVVSMNCIINGKYILFDKWYSSITQQNFGLFKITSESSSYLIDGFSEIIRQLDDDIQVVTSDKKYIVGRLDNKFYIFNNNYDLLYSDFTSIMWSDHCIWGMNTFSSTCQKHYFNGQCNEVLQYAHGILISQQLVALFEKKGIWYYIDSRGQLVECIRNFILDD